MSPTIPLQRDVPAAEGFRAVLAHLAATIEVNRPRHDRRRRPGVPPRPAGGRASHAIRAVARQADPAGGRPLHGQDVVHLVRRHHRRRPRPRRLPDRVGRLRQRADASSPFRPRAGAHPPAAAAPTSSRAARRRPAQRPGRRPPGVVALVAGRARRPRGAALQRRPAGCRHADGRRGGGSHRAGPAADDRGWPGHRRRVAGGGGARAAQGRQAAALPVGVLRRPLPGGTPQGVRPAAEGAAGQPRQAPGRRRPRDAAAPRDGRAR